MSNKKMGVLESRFADFIWNNEPVTSGQFCILYLTFTL